MFPGAPLAQVRCVLWLAGPQQAEAQAPGHPAPENGSSGAPCKKWLADPGGKPTRSPPLTLAWCTMFQQVLPARPLPDAEVLLESED